MYYEVMDSVQITARLPEELVAWLDKFAAEHHWSRATAVRVLIERGRGQEGERQ